MQRVTTRTHLGLPGRSDYPATYEHVAAELHATLADRTITYSLPRQTTTTLISTYKSKLTKKTTTTTICSLAMHVAHRLHTRIQSMVACSALLQHAAGYAYPARRLLLRLLLVAGCNMLLTSHAKHQLIAAKQISTISQDKQDTEKVVRTCQRMSRRLDGCTPIYVYI